ncbi:hypothetical protein [Herbidospora yilanensis]|uniref:hypothetical protein n=1 Tax=Herbidospora yilanensis TaxID=354426 RepID=UPI0012F877BE|nr:hypothetical protein [Herbidospora yilanensis]
MSETELEITPALFDANPDLVPALLRETHRTYLPHHDEVRLEPSAVSDESVRVVTLRKEGAPVLGCVITFPDGDDSQAHWSWPSYATDVRARHECPVVLMVMWPYRSSPERVFNPIVLGPSSVITPHVVRPDDLPSAIRRLQKEGGLLTG